MFENSFLVSNTTKGTGIFYNIHRFNKVCEHDQFSFNDKVHVPPYVTSQLFY